MAQKGKGDDEEFEDDVPRNPITGEPMTDAQMEALRRLAESPSEPPPPRSGDNH